MTCTPRIVRIRARIASASATPEMAISFIAIAPCNVAYYTKFRGNEITARTKSTAAQSAAEVGHLGQRTVKVGAEVGLFF